MHKKNIIAFLTIMASVSHSVDTLPSLPQQKEVSWSKLKEHFELSFDMGTKGDKCPLHVLKTMGDTVMDAVKKADESKKQSEKNCIARSASSSFNVRKEWINAQIKCALTKMSLLVLEEQYIKYIDSFLSQSTPVKIQNTKKIYTIYIDTIYQNAKDDLKNWRCNMTTNPEQSKERIFHSMSQKEIDDIDEKYTETYNLLTTYLDSAQKHAKKAMNDSPNIDVKSPKAWENICNRLEKNLTQIKNLANQYDGIESIRNMQNATEEYIPHLIGALINPTNKKMEGADWQKAIAACKDLINTAGYNVTIESAYLSKGDASWEECIEAPCFFSLRRHRHHT